MVNTYYHDVFPLFLRLSGCRGDNVGYPLARTVCSNIQNHAGKAMGAQEGGDQFTRGAPTKAGSIVDTWMASRGVLFRLSFTSEQARFNLGAQAVCTGGTGRVTVKRSVGCR